MKAEAKKLKEKRIQEVKDQWKQNIIDDILCIKIKYYHGSLHKRDIDNYGKLVLDCMSGIVYIDDSQIKEMHLYKYIDKQNPRVEINIISKYEKNGN